MAAEIAISSTKRRKGSLAILLIILISILILFALYYGLQRCQDGKASATVVYRKSHGFRAELLENGKIYWFWERLLPGFWQKQYYPLKPQQSNFKLDYFLPQAEFYKNFVVGEPDFNYLVELLVHYQLGRNGLIELIEQSLIASPDDLAGFYLQHQGEFRSRLLQYLTASDSKLEGSPDEVEQQLLQLLQQQSDSQLQVGSVELLFYSSPDLKLYQQAKVNYSEFNRSNSVQILQQNMLDNILQRKTSQQLLNLKELGEVLQQYPKITEYLQLFKDDGNTLWQPPEEAIPKLN